jgi:molybdenum cofactor synthesis domain-containing protein
MSTVSIIIIGNEILTGKFQDENTPWLIEQCKRLHLTIQTVRIIIDDIDTIAEVVSVESQRSKYVFTTGGVGPTHDDLTFAGVALAFGMELTRNKRLENLIRGWFGDRTISEDTLKMADIPSGARLLETRSGMAPQVIVNNVYIFPGIPKLLQRKFSSIEHNFTGKKSVHRKLGFRVIEATIATDLRLIQERFPNVDIGSYPRYGEDVSLIITVDGLIEEDVEQACRVIKTQFQDFEVGNKEI